MPAPQPQFIPEAFAQDAAGANRNTIPAAPLTTQRASFELGFPPLTMTPVVAGGKPMLGPDLNGILYMLSTHTYYQQSGQAYRWSNAIATAIGGYAAGTVLGSTDGVTLWFNLVATNATDPDAGGAGWVPMYSYGATLMPPTNGGVVTLTPAQASKSVIVLSGALAGNLQVVLPNSLRRWLIVNTTTGGFSTTVKTAAGAGIVVGQGGYAAPVEVYGDGTNIYNVVAPTVIPGDVAPTPNTYALRSNTGYLYAVYLNQSSPLENFALSEVFAGAGDGFLRKISRLNFAANFGLNEFAGQVTNGQVPVGPVNQHRATILNDSVLTGTPTAPTPAAGDNSTKPATTAFVQAALAALAQSSNTQLKFGTVAYGAGSNVVNVAFAFGSAFPTTCLGVMGICASGGCFLQQVSRTTAGATLAVTQRENGGGIAAGSFFYIAIGN